MDYLGLTNAFLVESGASDVVASLDDPADDVAQAMHWLDKSWMRFQLQRYWRFRYAEGSIVVTPGKTAYNLSDLARNAGDVIIRESFWNTLSGNLENLTYEAIRDKRRNVASTDTTKVTHIALLPENTLHTYPDIAANQTLSYDYWKAAQVLTAATDIPYGLPEDYHMLIVHKALTNYGALIGGQEGANLYNHHGGEYRVLFNAYVAYAGEDNEIKPTIRSIGA